MDPREHPLRRRYALEVALGLALIALALWVLLGRDEPDSSPPGAPPASGSDR